MNVREIERLTIRLKRYFEARADVAMAFLFGSASRNRMVRESDLDIAVYFTPGREIVDIESDYRPPHEDEVWADLERICERQVDLLVLNRAPVDIADEIFHSGIPLLMKDRSLYWRYFLPVTRIADDFRDHIADYVAIKSRSRSLNPTDRTRLLRIIDFLHDELDDSATMKEEPTFSHFESDRGYRRNLERWVENLANATIDAAKIVLASSGHAIPRTYHDVIADLKRVRRFEKIDIDTLADCARLRNLLVHEYLDVRFERISKLLVREPELHEQFEKTLQEWMTKQDGGNKEL